MSDVDVSGLLGRQPLHLELGCGPSKRNPESIGVDVLEVPGVDVVGDALEVLRALPGGSVQSIYSEHFLEHIEDVATLLGEASRVLVAGGRFTAVVPHFSNPYFYSDPTHRTFFGLYTFGYLVRSTPFRRKVPHYQEPLPFALEVATFVFKAARPFYVRHAWVKFWSLWVNLSTWTREFYEGSVCWLLPCYEVRYSLVRLVE